MAAMKNIDKGQVVIIGAGMAGLSAAYHLYENGVKNITVLEAQDRIGGRINTVQFGNSDSDIVELGANWIHGTALINPVMTLANQARVLDNKWILLNRSDGFCYKSNGEAISPSIYNTLWKQFLQWENESTFYQPKNSKGPPISLEKFFKHKLEDFKRDHSRQNEHTDIECVANCFLNYERFHHGNNLSEIPVPDSAGMYSDIPGGNLKVPKGIIKMVNFLAEKLPENCVKLNSEVTKVSSTEQSVTVRCSNGKIYSAHHVIITVSLGVLKQCHSAMFDPPLPDSKVNAMNSLDFGKVNKIFLRWSTPFWRQGFGGIKLGWSDKEMRSKNMPDWWCKKIFGFDEVLDNRCVLVGWLSGDEAEYIEILSDKDIIDGCIEVLRRFLKDPSIPRPVEVLHSTWCTNPYTRGCYSNVNFATKKQSFFDLGEPLYSKGGKPRLLFAGEATCPFGYSTMHGARRSGLREAQRLIQHYSKCDNLKSKV